MNSDADVIVIGGGAAGMMAAITAAENGKDVIIAERNDRLGKKLLITGKGRCNVTNNSDCENILKNIPVNSKFMYSALMNFTPQDTINFFENNGVPLKTERGNRVFPCSDKAKDIVTALENHVKRDNVHVINERVKSLIIDNNTVQGVVLENGMELYAKSVIIATGGKSYPRTGSTGDGYILAQQAGHTITTIKPSLVPIVSNDHSCKEMQGLSLKNVSLKLIKKSNNKCIYEELGEMLFTHFGVSGPLILSASSHIPNIDKNEYLIELDLKPGLTEKQLDLRILRDFSEHKNSNFINSLEKLLPRKMIPVIVRRSRIFSDKKVNEITKEERKQLLFVIKNFKISVDGFRPVDEAIVTSGGVKVSEINPKTMGSKLVKGLHFAGEVMDVDGYTGGYNLQIAFSTGYAAGNAVI